ncbi:MAG: hypothetical protein LBT21_00570 [Oscillospiraceae bacterium]|nr:hypothetical protein [Oscillospiraceae bacterium]
MKKLYLAHSDEMCYTVFILLIIGKGGSNTEPIIEQYNGKWNIFNQNWHLLPPGNDPIIYQGVQATIKLGESFIYVAALVFFVIILCYAYSKKFAASRSVNSKGGTAALPVKQMSSVSYKIRWLFLVLVLLATLFAGSLIFGKILASRLGGSLPSMQIDGGLALSAPIALLGTALLFPRMPLTERMKPVTFAMPFAMFALKIGCFIEQINHGKPVSWGIHVFQYSLPATKYNDPDVRIFPYNLFILGLCALAAFLVITRNKKGKSFQHIALICYGCTFFLDFFLGRDLGKPILGFLNPFEICHLILMGWGIYLLVLERREESLIKAQENRRQNRSKKKKAGK